MADEEEAEDVPRGHLPPLPGHGLPGPLRRPVADPAEEVRPGPAADLEDWAELQVGRTSSAAAGAGAQVPLELVPGQAALPSKEEGSGFFFFFLASICMRNCCLVAVLVRIW